MNILACNSYHSRTDSVKLLRLPDAKSAYRLYYVSIIGRDKPENYEWEHCALNAVTYEELLLKELPEGVGFITAFPHITKIFRFAPAVETVLHVSAFTSPDLKSLDLARADSFMEFACYAEAAIGADEYHAWARAESVQDYLAYQSSFVDGPVLSNRKLADYWT